MKLHMPWLLRLLAVLTCLVGLELGLGAAASARADAPRDTHTVRRPMSECDELRVGRREMVAPTQRADPWLSIRRDLTGKTASVAASHPPEWLIPDSEFVYGPSTVDFDIRAYVEATPGYLKYHVDKVDGVERDGSDIILYIARRYSINPRLLLALLEWKGGWLSRAEIPPIEQDYAFGFQAWWAKGLYKQLEWAANYLNVGFYAPYQRNYWQVSFLDSWRPRGPEGLNSGTYGLSYFLARMVKQEEWDAVRAPYGSFMQVYRSLFGDPWTRNYEPLVPPGLKPFPMRLPWPAGETWWFTGAPHGGWGYGSAWGAIDFGPGDPENSVRGCFDATGYSVTAATRGLVVVSDIGEVIQDLDGDELVQTGWLMIYNHLATLHRVKAGAWLEAGDWMGHPSCEGGWSSGVHLHLARRYNGVWIPTQGPGAVPMDISGWRVNSYGIEYKGSLNRLGWEPRVAVPWRVPGQNDVVAER